MLRRVREGRHSNRNCAPQRHCLKSIRGEIRAIEEGKIDRTDNPLKNAPHTAIALLAAEWKHPYSRKEAAYPTPTLVGDKYWPPVGRADNVYGDRNLFCSCIPVADDA